MPAIWTWHGSTARHRGGQATAGSAATVSVRRGLEYHWLGMNVQSPKLSDLRVRRAIQRAINVTEVTRAVFGDSVAPALGAGALAAIAFGGTHPQALQFRPG